MSKGQASEIFDAALAEAEAAAMLATPPTVAVCRNWRLFGMILTALLLTTGAMLPSLYYLLQTRPSTGLLILGFLVMAFMSEMVLRKMGTARPGYDRENSGQPTGLDIA